VLRSDIGYGQLSDGPRASGSFGVVVEEALHLGRDDRGELLVVDALSIVSNEAPFVQVRILLVVTFTIRKESS